jgi:endonuclease-3
MALTKKERAKIVREMLDGFYPNPVIPLSHRDPFTMLVAVVLSAQCTDARVNLVTPELFRLAHTPEKMAKLDVETIRAVIRPCGLSERKAASIKGLSEIIARDYDGQVPADIEKLEELPGVGHKTASVLMVQAFDTPAFPVDTHIHRLAGRWKLSDGTSVEKTERDLKALYPADTWGRLHLQIIHYGRNYCTARGCDGKTCPICARLNGSVKN